MQPVQKRKIVHYLPTYLPTYVTVVTVATVVKVVTAVRLPPLA